MTDYTALKRVAMRRAPQIDPLWSVNELLRRHPTTSRVLNSYGVDTCCGGATSLTDAAREAGLDLTALLAALGEDASRTAAV